ncbi:STAS domain-containing protein [Bacillus sp. JJ722]|uniref:STAS domain-containing protein n=1 Tax=Bacillus sp. JJ722 TaxID=3122973 RepID=UPI003F68A345
MKGCDESVEKNKALRDYFQSRADQLTEEWYETVEDHDPDSVYSSTNPAVIQNLKSQNNEFHLYVCNSFVEDEEVFFDEFNEWILKTATDSYHVSTPIHYILREFSRVRQQYLDYLSRFVEEYENKVSWEQSSTWNRKINRIFDITITKFVEVNHKTSTALLVAQQEMIYELSSPVISLKNSTALLPLVGDVDTARAKIILEKTLKQCSEKGITHLFIDLSGVVLIDTMVANEIFQLIKALKLIGVSSTLSGIRPEIAVTAMHLGLSFDQINVTTTLSQAIFESEKVELK